MGHFLDTIFLIGCYSPYKLRYKMLSLALYDLYIALVRRNINEDQDSRFSKQLVAQIH